MVKNRNQIRSKGQISFVCAHNNPISHLHDIKQRKASNPHI